MLRPGTKSATCARVTAPTFSIWSGPISWIAIGTFCTSCLRPCAVTVTTWTSSAGAEAAVSGAAAAWACAPALASEATASAMEVSGRTRSRCMSVLQGNVVLAVAGHRGDPVADQLHALAGHGAAAQLGHHHAAFRAREAIRQDGVVGLAGFDVVQPVAR